MNARKLKSQGGVVALESARLELVREDHALSERPWTEASLAGEKRLLEMIAGGQPLPLILEALCLIVEGICCGSLCSILFLDGKGERLWEGAAPSLPKSYLAAFNGREIASCWGPCGAAAFHKEQVIAADVQSDPRWDGCRDFVLSHGLRACWSTPIFSSDARVLGTLAILSREPCKPTLHDQGIIKQFTHLASIAIERNRSEEALRRSEAYLAEAQKLSHTGSFGWNLATGKLVWSAETFCILGYERTSAPTLEMVLNRVHPEDRPLVSQMLEAAAREGRDLNLEHRLLMPDGSVKHLHVLGQATGDVSGKVEFVGAVMDVTERKRAAALVAGEKRILEMIAGGVALPSILDAICRFGEEMVGEALVSILLVSADRKNLRRGAAPSLPQDFIEAIGGGLIGPCAGSCGTAAYRNAPVIVSDIATDPLWVQCRPLALKNGLRACWSTPIFSASREVVGTFALYAREPSEPTVEQRNVIEQMTRLAAVAIERQRAEEALRRSESRFEGILQIAEDAIISVDSNRRIMLFNQGAEKVFGFAATEVIGQPLELLMPHRFADRHREHFEEFARSPEISRTMAQRREVFGRRKDGREFPAEASISKLELGEEVVFTVILRDITERKLAEENLRQSEADLREAQRLTHVGSWRQDLASGKVKVSPEMHRIFQIQPYEDASDPLLYRGRVHPEDRQRVRELFDRCKKEKIAGQAEFRIVLPDGTIRHHHSVGRPVLNQAGDAVEFVGTAMDVTEQKEAQEALHASEHLTRGQVAALTSALEALARESDPDRLLEHVLRTIVEQTQAQSIAAWNRSEDGVRFDLIAVIENDRYQARDEASHPAGRLSMRPEHHPVWREVLQTGQHGLMDDIDKESARMCVGSQDWHRMVEDVDPDPAFTILMNHLREMGVRAVLFIPILIAGNVAGMLAIRFQEKRTFRREEIGLTRALAHQAMLSLRLMRLSQQSRQAAVMAERNRVARDIHDTLAQGFTGVIVQLEAVGEAMSQGLTAKAGECLARAGALARESLQEARRSVRALRLQALERRDVCEALQNLIRKLTGGTSLRAEFKVSGQQRELPPEWEENLLRIGQEVLTNVLRHAQATEFKARLAFEKEAIRLDLCDNGKGFDQAGRHNGFGLQGIKERAQAMGGRLRIQSAKNKGTAISIVLPLAQTLETLAS